MRYLAFQPLPPLPLLTPSLVSTFISSFRLFLPFLLALFLLLPFILLFLFLPFGVADIQADRQTHGRIETEVMRTACQHISERRARVAIANMRACLAQPKSLLNVKNVARQDALIASLYDLDRNQSALSRHVQNTLLSVDRPTMFVSHYTGVHRSKSARLNL